LRMTAELEAGYWAGEDPGMPTVPPRRYSSRPLKASIMRVEPATVRPLQSSIVDVRTAWQRPGTRMRLLARRLAAP
jgi:hypothetical protein